MKRWLFGSSLILVGLVSWLWLSPGLIALGGDGGAFTSHISWLGLCVCVLGVGLVIYGMGCLLCPAKSGGARAKKTMRYGNDWHFCSGLGRLFGSKLVTR